MDRIELDWIAGILVCDDEEVVCRYDSASREKKIIMVEKKEVI